TGTYSFHLSWKEYQYDAINSYWAPMTFMTKTLNVAGFPDVITIKTFDSLANAWVPSVKQMMTYNTNNNPIKLDEYIYNFTSFPSSPDFTTHYYYESFVNTTSINDQVKQIENITVYPNPANNILNITGIETNKPLALVSLYDMQGRILINQEIMIVNGNSQLSVSDFSPGNYLLVLRDEALAIMARQSVVIIK
ncbi:MAG: T9SS type A sorting domain-containing protein, partial [Bacteroidetes bacterium]|nr:T9SS type A sorting domain-containing protein [Bacteroidota bacterium]